MSEQIQEGLREAQVVVEPQEQIAQPNEYEVKAREAGWRPKEEFSGDPEQWIDAKEFVQRGVLYDRVHKLTQQNKQMERTLNQLAEHNRKVEQAAYKQALADLKAQKRAALDSGDTDAVIELDERLLEVRDAAREYDKQATAQANQPPQEYFDFASRNVWYTKDAAMTAYADAIGKQLQQNGVADAATFFQEVERAVKREFAHKFKRQDSSAPAVEGATTTKATSKTAYVPSEAEKRVAKDFVRLGVFASEQEYYKQLASVQNASKRGN